MAKRLFFAFCGFALSAFVIAVIWFNVFNLNAAYGNGPPYYARTTNMDKWTNPLPVLVGIDIVAAIAVALCVYLVRRFHCGCLRTPT